MSCSWEEDRSQMMEGIRGRSTPQFRNIIY